MEIKNISNTNTVNLDNCESEPIHIPGSIQPFGFLIAVDANMIVRFCSENITAYLQLKPSVVIGRSFADIFGAAEQGNLDKYLANPEPDFVKPHVCSYENAVYNTAVHKPSADITILEFEPLADGYEGMPDVYLQTKRFLSVMEQSKTLKTLCQSTAEEIKRITGYDRVMIYKFDKAYNGEVYAESKREDLEPFLGLHYPHTDIPIQARILYMKNLMRLITDLNYAPVPIVAAAESGADNASLDLSMAVLRSVSPIHVQYLLNMGVSATLTISLIQDGKLWGLVACHHYSAKNIPYYVRLSALLQGHFLTSQISVRMVAEEHDLAQKTEEQLNVFQDKLTAPNNIDECIEEPSLRALANADGVAIRHNKKLFVSGQVPAEKEILKLLHWLHANGHKSLVTSNLASVYDDVDGLSTLSAGIIFFSINSNAGDSIIWFRGEKEKSINWAGDPEKSIVKDEKGLFPRKSFELWKEIIRHHSSDWATPEINAATNCAYSLSKDFLLADIIQKEEYQRSLSGRLKNANDELANLNYIGSHDLKEPLRKIQVFASKMLNTAGYQLSDGSRDIITRMEAAANRMQNLLDDILNYSRLGNIEKSLVRTDLNIVLQEAVDEMDELVKEKNATIIKKDNLPVIMGIPFQLRQLFINLLNNGLKFSAPDGTAIIEISCDTFNDSVYKITITDNGIGFKSDYATMIFKVFQRLNTGGDYEGTGIGLAICKKIMENHNGNISAEGELGKGATFALYFPKEVV